MVRRIRNREPANLRFSITAKLTHYFFERESVIVGYTRSPIEIGIDEVPRSLPTMSAQCIHIWNTGGSKIADYTSSGAGYEALREETYCEEK